MKWVGPAFTCLTKEKQSWYDAQFMRNVLNLFSFQLSIFCTWVSNYFFLNFFGINFLKFCCFWQFDCGIHPAYSGMAALPYFDEIDPSTIDVLLITQYVFSLILLLCSAAISS